jgi:hypothetical protein
MCLPRHPAVCAGPPPTPERRAKAPSWGVAKGHHYPRCEICHRAIVRGKHWCRPLGRSHRDPSTDTTPLTSTAPVVLPPLPPFPVEGVTFDCKVASELNLTRWNWRGRRERSKDQRCRVHNALAPYAVPRFEAYEITIHRIGWNAMDAHDSLRSASKSVADQIAEWIGLDDADPRITWLYSQEITRETELVQTPKGTVRQSVNRLRIEIRARV